MKRINESFLSVARKLWNIFPIQQPFEDFVSSYDEVIIQLSTDVRILLWNNLEVEPKEYCYTQIQYRQYGGYNLWDTKPLNFKSFSDILNDLPPEIQQDILFNLDLFT